MITLRPSKERGHADHGWLDTYHTFSFADYYDPDFMGFGALRVINQDRVAPARGFGQHGHQDMEIVSYVLDGVLEHKDSLGNGSQMRPGDVQLMSAGSGVLHSEFNGSSDESLHFLQMWVFPRRKQTVPRYEQKAFSDPQRRGRLCLVVSPDGSEGSLTIDQQAWLYACLLGHGEKTSHRLGDGRSAWIHVAKGRIRLNDQELGPGDGAAIQEEQELHVEGLDEAELVLWELPES